MNDLKENNIGTKDTKITRLPLTSDYVFKRIFGYQGNETITKSFISAVLNQNITEVILENSTTIPKDMWDDKVGILDVKAKIDNKRNRKIYYKVEH